MVRRPGIVAVCALAVAHAGCSIAFVRPTPQASAAGAESTCGSFAFPLADLGGAGAILVVSSFAAGALAASALYGIVAEASCRGQLGRASSGEEKRSP
jgi:hypothetical protein